MLKVFITVVITVVALVVGGAHAAAITDVNIKTLGGSDYEMVSSPSTRPLGIDWTMTNGLVDGVNITWTSDVTGDFNIKANIGGGGTLGQSDVSGTQDVEQTDLVVISPAVEAADVASVKVIIKEK